MTREIKLGQVSTAGNGQAEVEVRDRLAVERVMEASRRHSIDEAVGNRLLGKRVRDGVEAARRQAPSPVPENLGHTLCVRAHKVVLAEPMDPSSPNARAGEESAVDLVGGQVADAQQRTEDLQVPELELRLRCQGYT